MKAPFDGVVGERIANQGELLPIDGKILALLDTSHVEVAAQMPAADVVRLKVDQPVTVTLEGFGDREFQGRITRISPTAQPGSRSIPVYVEITDRHRPALRGGLFAMGSVGRRREGPCPRRACRRPCARTTKVIMCWPSRTACWSKSRSAPRTWSRGDLVEVKGLESGMTIVSAPLPGLKACEPVKVLEAR